MSPLPELPHIVEPVRIHFFDTDAGGLVHNVAYLRLIEAARTRLAEYCGWSVAEMTRPGGGGCPVVARTEIDYLKPARLGDDIHIDARLTGLEKVRFHIDFDLHRPADGARIAACRQVMVTVDLVTGRPRPLRTDWLERWPHLRVARTVR
jgi:acyl-CoA thioester hydrolase